ncbi:unnamed protein product, partial [Owenia fusiformis]
MYLICILLIGVFQHGSTAPLRSCRNAFENVPDTHNRCCYYECRPIGNVIIAGKRMLAPIINWCPDGFAIPQNYHGKGAAPCTDRNSECTAAASRGSLEAKKVPALVKASTPSPSFGGLLALLAKKRAESVITNSANSAVHHQQTPGPMARPTYIPPRQPVIHVANPTHGPPRQPVINIANPTHVPPRQSVINGANPTYKPPRQSAMNYANTIRPLRQSPIPYRRQTNNPRIVNPTQKPKRATAVPPKVVMRAKPNPVRYTGPSLAQQHRVDQVNSKSVEEEYQYRLKQLQKMQANKQRNPAYAFFQSRFTKDPPTTTTTTAKPLPFLLQVTNSANFFSHWSNRKGRTAPPRKSSRPKKQNVHNVPEKRPAKPAPGQKSFASFEIFNKIMGRLTSPTPAPTPTPPASDNILDQLFGTNFGQAIKRLMGIGNKKTDSVKSKPTAVREQGSPSPEPEPEPNSQFELNQQPGPSAIPLQGFLKFVPPAVQPEPESSGSFQSGPPAVQLQSGLPDSFQSGPPAVPLQQGLPDSFQSGPPSLPLQGSPSSFQSGPPALPLQGSPSSFQSGPPAVPLQQELPDSFRSGPPAVPLQQELPDSFQSGPPAVPLQQELPDSFQSGPPAVPLQQGLPDSFQSGPPAVPQQGSPSSVQSGLPGVPLQPGFSDSLPSGPPAVALQPGIPDSFLSGPPAVPLKGSPSFFEFVLPAVQPEPEPEPSVSFQSVPPAVQFQPELPDSFQSGPPALPLQGSPSSFQSGPPALPLQGSPSSFQSGPPALPLQG